MPAAASKMQIREAAQTFSLHVGACQRRSTIRCSHEHDLTASIIAAHSTQDVRACAELCHKQNWIGMRSIALLFVAAEPCVVDFVWFCTGRGSACVLLA